MDFETRAGRLTLWLDWRVARGPREDQQPHFRSQRLHSLEFDKVASFVQEERAGTPKLGQETLRRGTAVGYSLCPEFQKAARFAPQFLGVCEQKAEP